jgi:UDP-N-acetylglucosamine--N-acetylmuramyl-(pentapeptide) pyrophosphoryl-undecaprenol N-acetylglucosamine transferase
MLEAALKDIPTLLIELNAVPGFTNRLLASVVRRAAVGFPETAAVCGSKAVVTGHPVRKAFFSIPLKKHVPPFTVLILGGSQGAQPLNRIVLESIPLLATETARWRFFHQSGERDYAAVRDAYEASGFEGEVLPFIDDMPGALARADLVVSRAGAMTVAELAAAGKAAVFVPFPGATDQHQLSNARALERVGAARVIEQGDLSPQRLVHELRELVGDPDKLAEMGRRAKSLACPQAAERIADLIEELAR